MNLSKLLLISTLFFTNNVLALHETSRGIDFHLKATNLENAVSQSEIIKTLSFSHAHLNSTVLGLYHNDIQSNHESSYVTFKDLIIEVSFANYPAVNELNLLGKKTFKVNSLYDTLIIGQSGYDTVSLTLKMKNVKILAGETRYMTGGAESGEVYVPTAIAFTLEANIKEYVSINSAINHLIREENIDFNFVSEVPLPAAAWFFGSSLLLLASRKIQANNKLYSFTTIRTL